MAGKKISLRSTWRGGFILRAVNENQWIMVSAGHVRNPSSVNKFRCRIDLAVSSMNILIGDRGGLQRESYPDGIYIYIFFFLSFFSPFRRGKI